MKILKAVTLASTLATFGCGDMSTEHSEIASSEGSENYVCSKRDVPENAVVTGIANISFECEGNKYFISKPEHGMGVCDVSKVPTGFFRSGRYHSSNCQRRMEDILGNNAFYIKKL